MQIVWNIKLIFKLIALFIFQSWIKQVTCYRKSTNATNDTYKIFPMDSSCLTIGQTKYTCPEAQKLCSSLGGELADLNESLTILKNSTKGKYWIANLSTQDGKKDSEDKSSGVDDHCIYLRTALKNTPKTPTTTSTVQPSGRTQEFCTYFKIKPDKTNYSAELNCVDVDLTQCHMTHVTDSTTAMELMTDTRFHPETTSLPQEMCDCLKDTLQSTDDKAFQVVAIVFGCLLSVSLVMNIIMYRYRKTYVLKYQKVPAKTSRNDNSSVNVVAVSPDDNYEVCTSDESSSGQTQSSSGKTQSSSGQTQSSSGKTQSSSGQTQRLVINVLDCGNYSEVTDEDLACRDIANGHKVGVSSVNQADQSTSYTLLDHKGSHLVLKDPSHVYGLNSGSVQYLERPHDDYEVCASDESYSIKFQRRISDVVDCGNYSEAKEVGLVDRGVCNRQEVCGGESSHNLSQTDTYTALNHKGSHLALNDPSHVYGLNSSGMQSSFDELPNN